MEKFVVESNGDLLKLTIREKANVNKETVKILYRILYDDQRKLIVQFESAVSIEEEAKVFMNRIARRLRSHPLFTVVQNYMNQEQFISQH